MQDMGDSVGRDPGAENDVEGKRKTGMQQGCQVMISGVGGSAGGGGGAGTSTGTGTRLGPVSTTTNLVGRYAAENCWDIPFSTEGVEFAMYPEGLDMMLGQPPQVPGFFGLQGQGELNVGLFDRVDPNMQLTIQIQQAMQQAQGFTTPSTTDLTGLWGPPMYPQAPNNYLTQQPQQQQGISKEPGQSLTFDQTLPKGQGKTGFCSGIGDIGTLGKVSDVGKGEGLGQIVGMAKSHATINNASQDIEERTSASSSQQQQLQGRLVDPFSQAVAGFGQIGKDGLSGGNGNSSSEKSWFGGDSSASSTCSSSSSGHGEPSEGGGERQRKRPKYNNGKGVAKKGGKRGRCGPGSDETDRESETESSEGSYTDEHAGSSSQVSSGKGRVSEGRGGNGSGKRRRINTAVDSGHDVDGSGGDNGSLKGVAKVDVGCSEGKIVVKTEMVSSTVSPLLQNSLRIGLSV
ncbi:unnamed protein product [Choristocarpus tenellus]